MYGIFTYIYHKNQPNVVKYTIHGSYGYRTYRNNTRILWIGCFLGISFWDISVRNLFALVPKQALKECVVRLRACYIKRLFSSYFVAMIFLHELAVFLVLPKKTYPSFSHHWNAISHVQTVFYWISSIFFGRRPEGWEQLWTMGWYALHGQSWSGLLPYTH